MIKVFDVSKCLQMYYKSKRSKKSIGCQDCRIIQSPIIEYSLYLNIKKSIKKLHYLCLIRYKKQIHKI